MLRKGADNRPRNTSTFTTAEKLDSVSQNTSLLLSIGAGLPSPRKLRQRLQNNTVFMGKGEDSEAQTWMKTVFISNLHDTVYQNLHITEVKRLLLVSNPKRAQASLSTTTEGNSDFLNVH